MQKHHRRKHFQFPLILPTRYLAVRLPRLVMRQDGALRLHVHSVNVAVAQVNGPVPVAPRISHGWWAYATIHATREKHHRHEDH